ncbi:MAG: phosphorylase family protein, partial [Canibacter sp.]
MKNQLLVFAHHDEASAFTDIAHLVTGVGKINAATSLALALGAASEPVDEVVVLGTAGIVSDGHDLDTIVQITHAVQHDFSLDSPRLVLAPPVIDATATIATGDVFVKNDAQRTAIANLGATLVDMETYAYASVCERFNVPLKAFKIPSDFADSSTTDEEWDEIVFLKSGQLRHFW